MSRPKFFLVVASFLSPAVAMPQTTAPLPPPVPSLEQRLAGNCTNCHGPEGRSRHAGIVSLAGKPAAGMKDKLREFRQGGSGSTVMGQVAKAYSEDELDLLAEYFSRQPSQ